MRIFIDSADISEIEKAFKTGCVSGVTTNPSLIMKAAEKAGTDMKAYITDIVEAANEFPVSLEVTKMDFDGMISQAAALHSTFQLYGRVAVKIPVNPSTDNLACHDGLAAIAHLKDMYKHILINATLIMTPEQALLAALAGADYVSPFAGRIDDYLRDEPLGMKGRYNKKDYYPENGVPMPRKDNPGNFSTAIDDAKPMYPPNMFANDKGIVSGTHLVKDISEILSRNANIKTEIIAASIRNARQARECAKAGAHIATVPMYVLEEMMTHKKTAEGMMAFMQDAKKVPEYERMIDEYPTKD